MRYLGMFYAREPGAMMGLHDAPYATMGRHALCARDMACDGGAMALVNGRVENERELESALRARPSREDGDARPARLILTAYRMWGEDYPAHLRGPASSVVIDQDANRLVISRDRVGLTPLYYAARASSVAFSDAYAPILRAPFAEPVVDAAGLCELLIMNPLFSPGRTPLRDVKRLEPGCALVADARGCRVKRYDDWSAEDGGDAPPDPAPRAIPAGAPRLPQAPREPVVTKPDAYFPGGPADDFFTARAREAARVSGEVWVTTGARALIGRPYAPAAAARLLAPALLPAVYDLLDLPAYAAARYHEAAAAWAGETARGRLERALAARWALPRRLEREYALLDQYALRMRAPYAEKALAGAVNPSAEAPARPLPEGAGRKMLAEALADPDAPALAFLDARGAAALPDETQGFLARVDGWLRFHGLRLDLASGAPADK